jgi:acetoin utilization deacetylase AcuC-like enzyme
MAEPEPKVSAYDTLRERVKATRNLDLSRVMKIRSKVLRRYALFYLVHSTDYAQFAKELEKYKSKRKSKLWSNKGIVSPVKIAQVVLQCGKRCAYDYFQLMKWCWDCDEANQDIIFELANCMGQKGALADA